MDEWKQEAEKYDLVAQKHYKKIRSYLTLFQFRLNDAEKCDLREKLAQNLDDLAGTNDFIQDLDSYLEGFCFKLDKSVLPNQPKEVKIEIAQPEQTPHQTTITPAYNSPQNSSAYDSPQNFSEYTIDCNDIYTMQFFQ